MRVQISELAKVARNVVADLVLCVPELPRSADLPEFFSVLTFERKVSQPGVR